MVDGLEAPKPPSQVVVETCGSGISSSGRVSISGSNYVSGTTPIPRPSRARDLVTMAEVGSARLASLERVTTSTGSVFRGARAKPNSLGRSLRPSLSGGVVSIAVYPKTRRSTGCANKKQSPRKNSISSEL